MESDGVVKLRVKIRHLAIEAKIIRHEEAKAKARGRHDLRRDLANHRRGIVSKAAREAQLASAYLRGVPYKVVEPKVRPGNQPIWGRVDSLVRRYGEMQKRGALNPAGPNEDLDTWHKE